jgi:uncharacterized protein (TIGR01777 family)
MHALVTGATGFVGRRLVQRLERPVVLSRDVERARQALGAAIGDAYSWNPERELPPAAAFDGVEAVFHLAGDPVAEGRWNAAKKARIRDSRVLGTRNLVAGLKAAAVKPKVLVSASAVGWYGSRGDAVQDETAPPADDFLAQVCVGWEEEARAAEELGIRTVQLRIGLVLGEAGGALAKMLPPFKAGMGSPLASGNQYMPWIHIDDLVELLLTAADDERYHGPVNAVSPNPVTNREFTKTLGRVLGRPTFLPAVPAFVLKTMVGEFAEVLLASQRVVPRVARENGFQFRFAELEPALRDVIGRNRQ